MPRRVGQEADARLLEPGLYLLVRRNATAVNDLFVDDAETNVAAAVAQEG